MGGSVVTSLAGLRPDLVAGVILTESNLDPGGGMWSCRITSMTEDEFVARGYQELIDEQKRQCPTWARTLSLSSPVALYREASSLIEGTVPTWREIVYGLECPRFYIFGDKTLPDEDAEELPRHGVQVRVVERAGHNMVYDNPESFVQMLKDCLEQMP